MENRPIKAHLDEEMRAHIEFVLRRYLNDLLMTRNPRNEQKHLHECALTERCVRELSEAGT